MRSSIKEPVASAIFVYRDETPTPSGFDEISTASDRHPSLPAALAVALFVATEMPRGTGVSGGTTAASERTEVSNP